MIDIQEKKKKIISFLEENGPSLPVRIAKAIEMDPVFASAISSELLGSKQIKTSYIKIGASPLYLLYGQEQDLEKYTEHLKSVEKEAYLKIKDKKLIKDEDEAPAIRVALRNIKDFATPLKFQEKIMWKYTFATDDEINNLLSPPKQKIISVQKQEKSETKKEDKKIEKSEQPKQKMISNIFTEPKIDNTEPDFLIEVKGFLEKKSIKFVEEIRTEKKEVVAVVEISSQLGKIKFLLIAKNKKTATRDEIDAAIQMASKNKMPCLLIIRKEPSKPIQKIVDDNNLIKLEIIEDSPKP